MSKEKIELASSVNNPWKLNESDLTDNDKKLILQNSFHDNSELQNLAYIIKDVLSGDNDAAKRDEYAHLNLNQVRAAVDWIINNTNTDIQKLLLEKPYLLGFKDEPPTAEQFLTSKYIGAMSESIWFPVRKAFIEFFDPLKPYRNAVLNPSIGAGKSTLVCLILIYVACHFALMRSPHKFFGKASTSQPLDCKIYKPDRKHYYFMGEIKKGDIIYSPTTGSTTVESIQYRGKLPTYELELENGSKTRCSADHIWTVSYKHKDLDHPIWETVKTQFMIDNPQIDFYIFEDGDSLS